MREQRAVPQRQSFEEHDRIVTAILRADGAAAGRAAYAHASIVREASSVFANIQL